MEKKRGEEFVRRDVEKRLFKDIFLKRCEYLHSKRVLKEQEVYTLVKDFFKEFLDLDYEFTEQELSNELKRVYLDEQTHSRVNALLMSVFRIQYTDVGLSEEELRKILKDFERIVNSMVMERQHRNVLQRFFHKMFRKHEQAQVMKAPKFSQDLKAAVEARVAGVPTETFAPKEEMKADMPVDIVETKKSEVVAAAEENEGKDATEIHDWIGGAEEKGDGAKSDWVNEPVIVVDEKEEKKGGKKKEKKEKEKKDKEKKDKEKKNGGKKISAHVEKKKKDSEAHSSGVAGEETVVLVSVPPSPRESVPEVQFPGSVEKEDVRELDEKKGVEEEDMKDEEKDMKKLDPKERMAELLKKIDGAIEDNDAAAAKRMYNDMHLIYKNVSHEVKQEFFQRVHEAYKKIKTIKQ